MTTPLTQAFILSNHLIDQTIGPTIIYNHYIYEWWHKGRTFYVGCGTKRRAWNIHNPEAESIRRLPYFKVYIVQHNLPKHIAHSQERYRIIQRRKQGFTLYQRNS